MPRYKKAEPHTETMPEQVTAITKPDVTELSFYSCQELIREISEMADENGELTDDQVQTLVAAHTQSIVKLHSMCNFLKLLAAKVDLCKQRKKDINASQQHAAAILDRVEGRLADWVAEQGKSYHVKEYELKSRKSTRVLLIDGFDDPLFCSVETVVKPDLARIKEALEAGEQVPGASLVTRQNLSIL